MAVNLPENESVYDEVIESRNITTEEFIYANLNDTVNIGEPNVERSFLRRFITGITSKFINVDKPQNKSFLEYTIDGYNFIADKEVEVDKELDENGKVIAYKVNGENISLGRSNRDGTTH